MMKRYLYLMLIIYFTIIGCQSTQIIRIRETSHLTEPPKPFIPQTNITTRRGILNEYSRQLQQIAEWETWYHINITNYYNTNTYKKK